MRQVAYNIGYTGYTSSGVLNSCPFIWECDFPKFAKKIRQKGNTKALFKWAKSNHIPPSLLTLNITIWYETEYWNFTIKMINVREYRALWESIYKKEWKDVKKDNL